MEPWVNTMSWNKDKINQSIKSPNHQINTPTNKASDFETQATTTAVFWQKVTRKQRKQRPILVELPELHLSVQVSGNLNPAIKRWERGLKSLGTKDMCTLCSVHYNKNFVTYPYLVSKTTISAQSVSSIPKYQFSNPLRISIFENPPHFGYFDFNFSRSRVAKFLVNKSVYKKCVHIIL